MVTPPGPWTINSWSVFNQFKLNGLIYKTSPFQIVGVLVVFFIFDEIVTEHYVNKLWRSRSDKAHK